METNKMRDISREQFEAWYLERHCGGADRIKTCSNAHDIYYYTDTQAKWVAWQASREAMVVKLPETEYFGDSWSGGWAITRDNIVDALEEQGMKVAP